jgi:hypothetical protein
MSCSKKSHNNNVAISIGVLGVFANFHLVRLSSSVADSPALKKKISSLFLALY